MFCVALSGWFVVGSNSLKQPCGLQTKVPGLLLSNLIQSRMTTCSATAAPLQALVCFLFTELKLSYHSMGM